MKQPIGVFDSGIGGLTVVSELRQELPGENIFYIGDTARVPYGGKSQQTLERYSLEIAGLLLAEGAKLIVVACNSASAAALSRLEEAMRVPVIGVIEPGARAAVEAGRSGKIGVIGTRATVQSGAYHRNIKRFDPDAQVIAQACPLFVPLVEEGWFTDDVTRTVARRYLDPMIDQGIDTLVLGCTHYPLLRPLLSEIYGERIALIDSAQACARATRQLLEEHELLDPGAEGGRLDVALTDVPADFLDVATRALNLDIREVQNRRVQNYAMV